MRARPLDPLSRLSLLVFRSGQSLTADCDEFTAQWRLTSAQWKVMGALDLAEAPLSAAAIGRAMGLSRQAVMKQIHLLAEQGMVKARPNPADARAPVHDLTSKGRKAHEAMMAKWGGRADTLMDGIDARDFERACAVLEGLIERLAQMDGDVGRKSTRDARVGGRHARTAGSEPPPPLQSKNGRKQASFSR